MSRGLLFILFLTFMLVSSSIQGALATIISASLDPECGPPGTNFTLIIRFTGSTPGIQTYPDLDFACDMGEGVMGCYFTVPDGVYQIRITISQEGAPSQTVTFCPSTSSPVGGFMEPTNRLAVLAPYVAFFAVVASVAIVIVKPWKRPDS